MSDQKSTFDRYFGPLVARASNIKRGTLAWASLALAAVILLSVNLASAVGLKAWQADLTQDRLFTISDGTKEILRSVDEPIDVRLYFSRPLADASPDTGRYFERVRALFEQYRDISGGKLHLTVIDPEAFSDSEDQVVAAGLRGVRLNGDGEVGYFGLVATNSIDNQQTIPFFSPDRESFLEYDVTKLIFELANPKKRTIGLITALPLDGGKAPMREQPTPPWMIMGQIREFFDVQNIGQDVKEIPSGLDVLMVAQPTQLTAQAAYAIDQYALKGGKVLVFIDPVPESAQLQLLQAQGDGRDQVVSLLKGWGVAFDPKNVAADIRHARRVQFGRGGGGEGMVTDFVAWLGLDKSSVNQHDVLSSGIETLNIASGGAFSKESGASVNFAPILETSSDAELIGIDKVGMGADPVGLLRSYVAGGKKLVLAARLSGDVNSAFKSGPPPSSDLKGAEEAVKKAEDAAKAKPATDTEAAQKVAKAKAEVARLNSEQEKAKAAFVGKGRINAIVVGDTDMLADQFWVSRRDMGGQDMVMPTSHNAAFVVGALENLSGSSALIGLRGRGVIDRPFTLVENLRRQAERKFRNQEEALEKKLKTAQEQLQKLQASDPNNSVVLSAKEQEAADKFRSEMLDTRRQLREVKRALRQDIDGLDGWLKFANIAFVPLMLGMAAIGLSWRRKRQRRDATKSDR